MTGAVKEASARDRWRRMALMSRLDLMLYALDAQRKDERRKESEALHQIRRLTTARLPAL